MRFSKSQVKRERRRAVERAVARRPHRTAAVIALVAVSCGAIGYTIGATRHPAIVSLIRGAP